MIGLAVSQLSQKLTKSQLIQIYLEMSQNPKQQRAPKLLLNNERAIISYE